MQLFSLVKKLHGKYARCNLFILQNNGPLVKKYRNIGVPIFFGGLKKGDLSKAPWKVVGAQIRLIRAIIKVRPDIIHCFLPMITFMGSLAGRLAGNKKIIISRRALGSHQDRYPILIFFDKIANYLCRIVTVNSKARQQIEEPRGLGSLHLRSVSALHSLPRVRVRWRCRLCRGAARVHSPPCS